MLTIRTQVKDSPGKGVGVFSLEKINKGDVVWVEHPLFYRIITHFEFEQLPELQKEFIKKHATDYPNDKYFYLDLDDTRFLNHSYDPNIRWDKDKAFAIKDIEIGEEITVNYVELNPADKEVVDNWK